MPSPIDIQALLGDLDGLRNLDVAGIASGKPQAAPPPPSMPPMAGADAALADLQKGGQMAPGTHADVMNQARGLPPHPEPDGDEDDLMASM